MRPEAEQFVEDVADERLSLSVVQRVVLLRQLLVDDVPDLGLDLLARHLVECLQVDEVEQALVKLELEIGPRVAVRERTGVADRDDAHLLGRAHFGVTVLAARRFPDLPHYERSRPRMPATPASSMSMSLPTWLLRLISAMGTPRSMAGCMTAGSLAIV